jgi:hypothetical protein
LIAMQNHTVWSLVNTAMTTWFERDRSMVCLTDLNERTILAAWDDDVNDRVEDGFLNPRESAVEYANYLGLRHQLM